MLQHVLVSRRAGRHLGQAATVTIHVLIDLVHSEQLELLLLHHYSLVELEIDLVREHVQKGVREDLIRHFARIDQVVDVVELKGIQPALQVEVTE